METSPHQPLKASAITWRELYFLCIMLVVSGNVLVHLFAHLLAAPLESTPITARVCCIWLMLFLLPLAHLGYSMTSFPLAWDIHGMESSL